MEDVRNLEFFKACIQGKINKNRDRLGRTGEHMLSIIPKISYEDLIELNDMSLLLMYLDYIEALKRGKSYSSEVEEKLDKGMNFSLVSTFDGAVTLSMDTVNESKEEIREQSWFKAHDSGGAFVFEDYGLELSTDFDVKEFQDRPEKLDLLDTEISKSVSKEKEVTEADGSNSGDDFYYNLFDSLVEERENLKIETEKAIEEHKLELEKIALDMELTGGINTQLQELTEEELLEIEADWEDAFDDIEDEDEYGLIDEAEDENEESEEYDTQDDIDEDELEFESDEEEAEFEVYCNKELEEKWRGLDIASHLKLEFLDTQSSNVIDVFVKRGMIKLPDDLLELSDEMIDFLYDGGIIATKPVRKVEVKESTDYTSGNKGAVDSEHRQLFRSKQASDRVEAADRLRKRLGLSISDKLTSNSLLSEDEHSNR